MSAIGQTERATQNRVIDLFRDELGYTFLGDWTDRANSNVEEPLLTAYLTRSGYSTAQISRALDRLRTEANNPNRSLKVGRYFVQKMRTKWGSCSHDSKNIRLNTDLAKKPLECLEYIVVHELAHLLEPHRSDGSIHAEVEILQRTIESVAGTA